MKLPWQKIGEGDYKAESGDYSFRMERMSWANWWWAISFKGEEIDSSWHCYTKAISKAWAEYLVMEAYKKHLKKLKEKV